MAGKGGAMPGAGRKPKAEEQKVNTMFVNAMKTFYNVDTDDKAKEKLVHTLLESQRGQIFISEHLFGKPKETIDNNVTLNDINIKDIVNFKREV